jgi:hypothetical protein
MKEAALFILMPKLPNDLVDDVVVCHARSRPKRYFFDLPMVFPTAISGKVKVEFVR